MDPLHRLQGGVNRSAVAHTVISVNIAGVNGRTHQRPVGPPVYRRRLGQSCHLYAHQTVQRGLFHRHIAADRCQRQHLIAQLPQAHDDCYRVVRTGVRVDNDFPHGYPSISLFVSILPQPHGEYNRSHHPVFSLWPAVSVFSLTKAAPAESRRGAAMLPILLQSRTGQWPGPRRRGHSPPSTRPPPP